MEIKIINSDKRHKFKLMKQNHTKRLKFFIRENDIKKRNLYTSHKNHIPYFCENKNNENKISNSNTLNYDNSFKHRCTKRY